MSKQYDACYMRHGTYYEEHFATLKEATSFLVEGEEEDYLITIGIIDSDGGTHEVIDDDLFQYGLRRDVKEEIEDRRRRGFSRGNAKPAPCTWQKGNVSMPWKDKLRQLQKDGELTDKVRSMSNSQPGYVGTHEAVDVLCDAYDKLDECFKTLEKLSRKIAWKNARMIDWANLELMKKGEEGASESDWYNWLESEYLKWRKEVE